MFVNVGHSNEWLEGLGFPGGKTMVRHAGVHLAKPGVLKKYTDWLHFCFRFADLAAICVAAILTNFIRLGSFSLNRQYALALIVVLLISFAVFPSFGLYRRWRGTRVSDEIGRIALAWIVVILTALLIAYITKTSHLFSRVWCVYWVTTSFVLFALFRSFTRLTLGHLRRRGHNTRNIVVLGAGELGRAVAKRLRNETWAGFHVAAFFDNDKRLNGQDVDGIRVAGTINDAIDYLLSAYPLERLEGSLSTNPDSGLEELAKLGSIEHVWIALPLSEEANIRKILSALDSSTITVHLVPDVFGYELINHTVDELAGIPTINLNAPPIVGANDVVKRLFDIICAASCLLLAAPVMFFASIGIILESPGPILFKQRRYGLDGKEISVWKFRTMRVWDDSSNEVVQAKVNDPRVTTIGRFLRRTSLDELPQLINVLQGRMSLVGPRPHAVAHNELYRNLIHGYMLRHKVKPGITGWAQINGWRGETDTVEKMQKRVDYDIEYINNWSLWFDFRILLLTFFKGFTNNNAY